MEVITKTIGRLPLNKGDWDQGYVNPVTGHDGYGKKIRCNLYGCEWESLVENNTYPPATLVNGVVTPDTTHWRLNSGVPGNYGLDEIVGDKPYDPTEFSGMGRKVLPKNIQTVGGEEKNVLTQEMMSDSNTIYVIQYDYTLGENITVPANCILEFDGGSINARSGENKNTITATNTRIIGYSCFDKEIVLAGSFVGNCIEFDWWKCEKVSLSDYNTFINNGLINGTIPIISNTNRTIFDNLPNRSAIKFGKGIYPFDNSVTIKSIHLFAESKYDTLLWAPNSDFATLAGNDFGLIDGVTIEANNRVFRIYSNIYGTPAYRNRFTNSTFISYNDNCIEKPQVAGNYIIPFGWSFFNVQIYAGPGKCAFVNLMSEFCSYDHVEDAILFFNYAYVSKRESQGADKELAMFKDCRIKLFTNSNLSYIGWKYFCLISTNGLYEINIQNTIFEGSYTETENHELIANIIKTTVTLTSLTIRIHDCTIVTNTFDVAPIWIGGSLASFMLDVQEDIDKIFHNSDIGEPIFNYSNHDIVYITAKLDAGGTKRRIGVIEKGVTPANAVRYNNTIALEDIVTSGYPQKFADLISSDGQNGASEYHKCCTRGKSFPTIAKTQTSYQFYRVDLGEVFYFNGTAWVDATGATAGVARSGNTASRPIGTDIYVGFMYIDTTLGKPIYASAISGNTVTWVDALGNPVNTNYQLLIDANNKLSADLTTDGSTNKVVTATEKTTWNNKQNTVTGTAGNLAGFDANGKLADSGSKPSDFEPASA